MTLPITVIVPVGPLPRQTDHLQECLDSVRVQTERPDEILVVDNGGYHRARLHSLGDDVTVYHYPRALGIATAFNKGFRRARNELCFCLGSDDTLYPECLERCYDAWQRRDGALGWYYVAVEYSDGARQNTACLAALVSRELWCLGGMFDPDVKSCENEFISNMLVAGGQMGQVIEVSKDILYYHRVHD